MSVEHAIRAIRAIESLSKLMDMYDELDEEEPKLKKRKIYVKSEDIETQVLKNITWKNSDMEDTFCPLTIESFEELLTLLSSKINRRRLKVPHISLRMRLALTLRYLVAGDPHKTLEEISHISRKCTLRLIPEMLEHIIAILEKDYSKLPKKEHEWIRAANDFNMFWEFPHTLGILDARNFHVRSPNSEPASLILISILDAHSRFQHIEIIENQEPKNVTAYKNSRLYKALTKNTLNIPLGNSLKGQTEKTPYFFVGSEIFGMDRYILKPYNETSNLTRSQKAFNFRINRAQSPAQMAFELMLFKFKIFDRLSDITLDRAKLIIRACCILHNYLIQKLTKPLDYSETLVKLEIPCSALKALPMQDFEPYEKANKTRENVCKYCVNEGNIPEQWKEIIKKE